MICAVLVFYLTYKVLIPPRLSFNLLVLVVVPFIISSYVLWIKGNDEQFLYPTICGCFFSNI